MNDDIIVLSKIAAIRAVLLQFAEDGYAYTVTFLLKDDANYPDPGDPFRDGLNSHIVILRPMNKTNAPFVGDSSIEVTLQFHGKIHFISIDYMDIICITPEYGAPIAFTYIVQGAEPDEVIEVPEERRHLRVVH